MIVWCQQYCSMGMDSSCGYGFLDSDTALEMECAKYRIGDTIVTIINPLGAII